MKTWEDRNNWEVGDIVIWNDNLVRLKAKHTCSRGHVHFKAYNITQSVDDITIWI